MYLFRPKVLLINLLKAVMIILILFTELTTIVWTATASMLLFSIFSLFNIDLDKGEKTELQLIPIKK
ncbi:hypothetical protein EV197_1615 [Aquimarina brevivitae]|uniref:Uncharacterized protein n=1 Tax=Aquimarina brevivitae TaxID=323412 RepID=A0A4Q7PJY9_9FLAO|nr:hypothetical protein EV197_1615 [Aquimarina brevivitae]